jgi:hypothetical protein
VGKPVGNRPLGRLRRKWDFDIKMDLKAVGWKCVEWIDMDQGRKKCRGVVTFHTETLVSVKCRELLDKLRLKNYPCIRGSVGSNSIIPAQTSRYIDNL